jgi:hypothetical protein
MKTHDRKYMQELSVDDWTWSDFLADHPEIAVESAWFRALFDDVRPGWEGLEAGERDHDVPEGLALRGAMDRALFDDVRPAWEESQARGADTEAIRLPPERMLAPRSIA